MKSSRIPAVRIGVVALAVSVVAVFGGRVVSAQDAGQAKYTVRVPNGSRSPSSRDTKAGRRSPSVTAKS